MENEKGVELSVIELQSLISNNVLQCLLISFRTKYAHTDYSFDFVFH